MSNWRAAAVSLLIAASPLNAQPAPDGRAAWRAFEGTWSAAGQRRTVPTETGRAAAAVHLSGALTLTTGEGLSRGFRAVMVGFDDGNTGGVGRSVWTDEHGDRIFGTVRSEPIATGRKFAGTITGGTGRYAGITGDYAFSWQYVVDGEDGAFQGRSLGLKGRFRQEARQP